MRRLVIRPGAVGDLILSLPALECLRADYLEVWAASPNVPLVRFANSVRSIMSTGLNLLGITDPPPVRLLNRLRSFDSIVSWYGANRPEFRELAHSLDLPFTFLPALPPQDAGMHATDFYLKQVSALTECHADPIPRIPCSVERENFAVIHPFSGGRRKNWPLEKFRQLARGLERRMPVRWCAGAEDPQLPEAHRLDDLYQLACWLAQASLYIGNDSGITHLAAAVGTPVLAIFGPTDPAVWAPRGEHVRIARWGNGPNLETA
ncbi:MAG: glycosyltransferase family 9 protein [Bryobacteraceae bacterium]|jgi:ADP-heptose:LPS heptosyltransferase